MVKFFKLLKFLFQADRMDLPMRGHLEDRQHIVMGEIAGDLGSAKLDSEFWLSCRVAFGKLLHLSGPQLSH